MTVRYTIAVCVIKADDCRVTAEVSVLHSASYDSQVHYSCMYVQGWRLLRSACCTVRVMTVRYTIAACVFKADDCRVTAELSVLHSERYDSQVHYSCMCVEGWRLLRSAFCTVRVMTIRYTTVVCVFKADDCRVTAEVSMLHCASHDSQVGYPTAARASRLKTAESVRQCELWQSGTV